MDEADGKHRPFSPTVIDVSQNKKTVSQNKKTSSPTVINVGQNKTTSDINRPPLMFCVPDSRSEGPVVDGKLPFECWVAMRASVDCVVCLEAMDEKRWPTSGRCGHTICYDCLRAKVTQGITRPTQFLPCPVSSCHHQCAFERTHTKNLCMMESINKLREIENGVMLNLQRIAGDNRRAVKHLQHLHEAKKNEYSSHLGELESKILELESKMLEKEAELSASSLSTEKSPARKKTKVFENCREDQFDW